MKVALYARVSTKDKGQDPETQLIQLREMVEAPVVVLKAEGGLHYKPELFREYVDYAAAGDLRRRSAWRDLLDDAASRRFDQVMVVRLDRAFRSVKHCADTLAYFDLHKISFRCLSPDFDLSTPLGRLTLHMAAAFAELEQSIISERVRAGMARAKARGIPVGRPKVAVPVQNVLDAYHEGISIRAVARRVGCTPGTAQRRLKEAGALGDNTGVQRIRPARLVDNGS